MLNRSKKPTKYILYWGVFLMIVALWALLSPPSPSSIFIKVVRVSGGATSLALCFLWYKLSQVREQRGRLPRTLGRILFLLGTFFLLVTLNVVGLHAMMLKSGSELEAAMSALITSIPTLLLAILSLILAYPLQFKFTHFIAKL